MLYGSANRDQTLSGVVNLALVITPSNQASGIIPTNRIIRNIRNISQHPAANVYRPDDPGMCHLDYRVRTDDPHPRATLVLDTQVSDSYPAVPVQLVCANFAPYPCLTSALRFES
jgi:hypothetical protein